MPKVLIIDDSPTIRSLFEYMFADAGYTVLLAEDGEQALRTLESEKPDLMVLDVSMPVKDGRAFIAELAERASSRPELGRIPFMVMTGENVMDPKISDAFASQPGFVCFIAKMTDPEAVIEKAAAALKR